MITSNGMVTILSPSHSDDQWRAGYQPPDGTSPIVAYGRSELHAAMRLADALGHALFNRPEAP